jgi:predicted RNase H-related nuclease YkuK (DUF458 family)
MASHMSEKQEGDILYQLYVENVKKEIRNKVAPEVERVVNECVDAAVKSLEIQLHQAYNFDTMGKTFKLIVEKKNL